jgi:hypothetical protein
VEIRVGFGVFRLPFRGIVAKVEVFDDLLVRFSVSQKRRRLDKVVAAALGDYLCTKDSGRYGVY